MRRPAPTQSKLGPPERSRARGGLAALLVGALPLVLAACPTPSSRGPSQPRPHSHRVEANMDGDEAYESRPSSSGQGSSHSISGEVDD